MPAILELNARKFRPLRILNFDSTDGCRVGGTAPANVSPSVISAETKYFGTFPKADSPKEVSIFTDLSSDPRSPGFIIHHMHRFQPQSNPLVQFVVHDLSRRGSSSNFDGRFDGHAVEIGTELTEDEHTEDDYKWTHHKFGGTPFYYQQREYVLKTTSELLAADWTHFLQMTSIGFGDADVTGDWPFWNQMFHVFLRDTGNGFEFQYIWS